MTTSTTSPSSGTSPAPMRTGPRPPRTTAATSGTTGSGLWSALSSAPACRSSSYTSTTSRSSNAGRCWCEARTAATGCPPARRRFRSCTRCGPDGLRDGPLGVLELTAAARAQRLVDLAALAAVGALPLGLVDLVAVEHRGDQPDHRHDRADHEPQEERAALEPAHHAPGEP